MNELEKLRQEIIAMTTADKLRFAARLLDEDPRAKSQNLATAIVEMATVELHRAALARLKPEERIP